MKHRKPYKSYIRELKQEAVRQMDTRPAIQGNLGGLREG